MSESEDMNAGQQTDMQYTGMAQTAIGQDMGLVEHNPISQLGGHDPAEIVAAAREENAKPAPADDLGMLKLKVEELEKNLEGVIEALTHHQNFLESMGDYLNKLKVHFAGKL
jgi:hypothetical protein